MCGRSLFHLTLFILCVVPVVTQCPGGQQEPNDKEGPPPKHYNIILIGATGDLAQKYLWTGLYDLFKKHYVKGKNNFLIYACARKSADKGRQILSDILLNVIKCSEKSCREIKTEFVQSTQYHQLKTEDHYKKLGDKVAENTQSMYALLGTEFSYEQGRIVYLAIPPQSYARTAKLVHAHLKPRLGYAWMRIVLEKPFGHDLQSAMELDRKLGKYFKEKETYRLDHYLGKPIVKHILPFRIVNKEQYEKLWNHHHIEKFEVVLKETVDVKGRSNFYDGLGVIRDVMQNHMIELVSLVAMELPRDSGNITHIHQNKVRLLHDVQRSGPGNTIIGQYASYMAETLEDFLNATSHAPDVLSANTTRTPTFAATVLYINNARWRGVPFILTSGKKLPEKASYVRVSFRNHAVCMKKVDEPCDNMGQIVFYIGSNSVKRPPLVAVSKSLPAPTPPNGLKPSTSNLDTMMFNERVDEMHLLEPVEVSDPYATLLDAVYEGQRHLFVDIKSLLAAWEFWTPVLSYTEHESPRIYEGKTVDVELLDFLVTNTGLKFINDLPKSMTYLRESAPVFGESVKTFRDEAIVSDVENVVFDTLADNLLRVAQTAIIDRGVFHLAVSGGDTPIKLFDRLAAIISFPWQQTHLWFVDERCVEPRSQHSNLNLVDGHLLRYINIPYLNVHPMPVQLSGDPCCPDEHADIIYEALIKTHVQGEMFDFVILGVGNDGHTASLFQDMDSVDTDDRLVILTSGGPKKIARGRLTLTLPMINNSRNIAVLVAGEKKHKIIKILSENVTDMKKYPITGVKPLHGNMIWYIDDKALHGKVLRQSPIQ